MGDMSDETLTILPQSSALRLTIHRKRKRDDAFPQNLEDIDIPEQFRLAQVGGTQVRFLLHDTGADINDSEEEEDNRLKRIILFGTDEMLHFFLLQTLTGWPTARLKWHHNYSFSYTPFMPSTTTMSFHACMHFWVEKTGEHTRKCGAKSKCTDQI